MNKQYAGQSKNMDSIDRSIEHSSLFRALQEHFKKWRPSLIKPENEAIKDKSIITSTKSAGSKVRDFRLKPKNYNYNYKVKENA